ncbi:helix-turn-helix domain-containing protein [Actinoallomurus spadix]|nr:helix-turn-helix domain-containing protein [Actinoallomurus spadix]MCO5987312.1 helix-turn-helix domain-containing protein [Actinoallomurus spadix]
MRFRLAPTPAQEQALLEHCSHARYVWNLVVPYVPGLPGQSASRLSRRP